LYPLIELQICNWRAGSPPIKRTSVFLEEVALLLLEFAASSLLQLLLKAGSRQLYKGQKVRVHWNCQRLHDKACTGQQQQRCCARASLRHCCADQQVGWSEISNVIV
jgi:hypothetical protein